MAISWLRVALPGSALFMPAGPAREPPTTFAAPRRRPTSIPNGTEAGSEPYRRQDPAGAGKLPAEAGHQGEKIVLITTAEIPSIAALGDVTADSFRKRGVNVELAVSDWGTMVARRAK